MIPQDMKIRLNYSGYAVFESPDPNESLTVVLASQILAWLPMPNNPEWTTLVVSNDVTNTIGVKVSLAGVAEEILSVISK